MLYKTSLSAAPFSLIMCHVIQTHFSECKGSWCREAAQRGSCFLHSAAQSHLGKDGLQKNSIHKAQAWEDVTLLGRGLGFASLCLALSLLCWECR